MKRYYIYKRMSNINFTTKIMIIIAAIIILIFAASHIVSSKQSSYKASATTGNIIYKSVYIKANDTLWSIADRYYTDEFGSVRDYVNEIKRCNSLSSDAIYAGRYIVVPIYNNPL